MKTIRACFVGAVCIASATLASPGKLENLRVQIETAKHTFERCGDDLDCVFENMTFCWEDSTFRALQREMNKSWRWILKHLDELAPDDAAKLVLLCSSCFMDENEFGIFLQEVADLAERGNVSPEILGCCMAPWNSPLEDYGLRHENDPQWLALEAKYEFLLEREKMRKEAAAAGVEFPSAAIGTTAQTVSLPSSFPQTAEREWLLPSILAALGVLGAGSVWFFRRQKRRA